MQEAQEMFKNANKVTRPEKALILGFMAGSRGKMLHWFPWQILRKRRFNPMDHFSLFVFRITHLSNFSS